MLRLLSAHDLLSLSLTCNSLHDWLLLEVDPAIWRAAAKAELLHQLPDTINSCSQDKALGCLQRCSSVRSNIAGGHVTHCGWMRNVGWPRYVRKCDTLAMISYTAGHAEALMARSGERLNLRNHAP